MRPIRARPDQQLSGKRLLCYLSVRHEYKLPDILALVLNANGITGLPISRHFPCNADGVLKILGGIERILGVLAGDVKLRHDDLLCLGGVELLPSIDEVKHGPGVSVATP